MGDRCRELENSQSEFNEKIKGLEKAADGLRERIRELEVEVGKPADDSHWATKVAELEQKIKLEQEQKSKLEDRIKQLEADIAGNTNKGDDFWQDKLKELERQLKEQKDLVDKAKKEAEIAKA